MAEPYLSQITIVAFNFAPRGYALCDGQILPINQNQELFSLLGTTFGGDGRTSFALPDLRGRVPIHFGTGAGLPTYSLGQRGGEETHTLTIDEMPTYTHQVKATSAVATAATPRNDRVLAQSTGNDLYLALGFCIALTGMYPSQS